MLRIDGRQHVKAAKEQGATTGATIAEPVTATLETDSPEAPGPTAPPADGALTFQRCRWCRTPNYRRSLCRACGSTDLACERSSGRGVVVRRDITLHNTCFVTMEEGFSLFCKVTGAPPMGVVSGARVRVVSATEPPRQALPVVEFCGSMSAFHR
ncbi:Zn-ribbon domain-containing OB-fold protein [Streptomyces sp. NPDC057623]|uniref:Zn-ribbon domain-containing OB-fold protein n=1 Tax=Streptomyces sp. NPDC057623 TaxID=3346187 RepID=UPI0036C90FE6